MSSRSAIASSCARACASSPRTRSCAPPWSAAPTRACGLAMQVPRSPSATPRSMLRCAVVSATAAPPIESRVRILVLTNKPPLPARYDVVVARPLEPLLRSGILGMRVRVVLDVDDLESEVLRQRFGAGECALPSAIETALLRRLRAIEARTFDACDHLWLASEEDHRRLSLPRCSLLPNVPWLPEGSSLSPTPVRASSRRARCSDSGPSCATASRSGAPPTSPP